MFYIASSANLSLYIIGQTQYSQYSKAENHCLNSLARIGYVLKDFEMFTIYSLPGEEESFKANLIDLNNKGYKPLNRSFKHLKLILDMTGDSHILDNLKANKEAFPKNNNKKAYGEYKRVILTEAQYNKLCDEYTKDVVEAVIVSLDEYLELNNNKNHYSNYYILMKRAIREDWYHTRELLTPKKKAEEVKPEPIPECVKDFLKEIK